MRKGLIGEKLSHSFSKEIHESLTGTPYELIELSPQELPAFMTARDFSAINVTIPYKQAVIPYLDRISDTAKAIGAVNTIVNRGGMLCGYNTDFGGMCALISRIGIDLDGKKVLILGTGGTSLTANAVARHLGAKEVLRVSRTGKDGAITYDEMLSDHTDADVLINTTPCGMFPNGGCPVDIGRFSRLCGVVDAIYNPLRTPLVRQARARGIPAEGGLFMLVMQAVLASEIFTDSSVAPSKAHAIFNAIAAQKENIVLIGMPGSGKTTVAKLLSEQLHRPWEDTDAQIVRKSGMSISELFAECGEATFRDLESEVIREMSRKNGIIIATGGGAVLREENVDELRANGKLVFLDRPVEELLPTADRPLAMTKEAVLSRWREREVLYRAAADLTVGGEESARKTAESIIERGGWA